MAQATTAIANKPAWIELSSKDPAASRDFYSRLFGWHVEVSPDPQYGGYGMAKVDGDDVAGIGPSQSPEAPTAWGLYIGSPDVDDLAKRVAAAGGTVVAEPFDVGDQGRMAVFQDPTGAFISGWQPSEMGKFRSGASNTFGWAELSSRGVKKAIDFYETVFGWTHRESDMGEGTLYNEFQSDGDSVAGAMEMDPKMPAQVPSNWTIYFTVDDVDHATRAASAAGGQVMVAPQEFPGGRFSIVTDPQGANFGLLKMAAR